MFFLTILLRVPIRSRINALTKADKMRLGKKRLAGEIPFIVLELAANVVVAVVLLVGFEVVNAAVTWPDFRSKSVLE